ncbi:MAG: hypothetical protein MJ249_14495 [Kiritimatiellae bacterium]|nr:hypothetical protein [Kiritimatiellia bacterium]
MTETFETQVIECPGCHRRFKRSDFKSDRLVCPACGREIPVVVEVRQQDEAKLVKMFLEENGIGTFLINIPIVPPFVALLAMLAFYALLISIIFCTVDSWWKWFWIAFFILNVQFMVGRYFRSGREIRKAFERCGYRLEDGLRECDRMIAGKTGKDRIGFFEYDEVFKERLRTFVRAHVEIKNVYGTDLNSSVTEREQVSCGQMMELKEGDSYPLPPAECPECGAPYRVGDFWGQTVVCRKCGKTIHVERIVSSGEIKGLLRDFVARYEQENSPATLRRLTIGCLVAALVSLFVVGSVTEYLYSWHSVWAYLAVAFAVAGRKERKMRKRLKEMLKQERPSLFELEFLVKDAHGENDSTTDLFYEFKDKLMDLYRGNCYSVKGAELS